jgi:hypothetical protein
MRSTALVKLKERCLRKDRLEGNQDISVLGKNEEDIQSFTGGRSLAVIRNLPPFRLQLANISTFCTVQAFFPSSIPVHSFLHTNLVAFGLLYRDNGTTRGSPAALSQ